MGDTCKDCHYSKTWGDSLHCRRYPPMGAHEQPEVHPTDWCGEFRPMRPLGRDAPLTVRSGGASLSQPKREITHVGPSRGGVARAEKLTPERRSKIARDAAKSRWAKALLVPATSQMEGE